MNKSHLWLLILFMPLVITVALLVFIFFTNPQSNMNFRIITINSIPFVIPMLLIVYIIASKHFLQITRKTIFFTTILTFIGASSLTLQTMLIHLNPQLMNNAFLSHKFINTVYQDLPHKQYVYSWNKYLGSSKKTTIYTVRFAETHTTTIKNDEYHVHAPNSSSIKNSFFQPFLRYFLLNSKDETPKSLAFFLSLSIMLCGIYTGISIVSLWTTNIFFQVIFLVNAYGILNVVLNLLTPYSWPLIVFMASLLILLLLFVIFRIYYTANTNAAASHEHKRSA